MNGLDLWRCDTEDGLQLIRCVPLLEIEGVAHAFSTRRDGDRHDFDLGPAETSDPRIERRRQRFCTAAGLGGGRLVLLRQIHGARIVRPSPGSPPPRADGVLSVRRWSGFHIPAVRAADCVPILLVEESGAAAAAVHAGWRGTAAGIAREAVAQLAAVGVSPRRLHAALGPAVGPCCYEVGEEVVGAIAHGTAVSPGAVSVEGTGGRARLDLRQANRLQLESAGVPARSIHSAPWCTACEPGLFFSFRRDGVAAGRQMACVGWRSLTAATP